MANSKSDSRLNLWSGLLPVVLLPVACFLLLAWPAVARRSSFSRQQHPMDSTSFYQLLNHPPEELCTSPASADLTPRLRSYCSSGSVADRIAHRGLVGGYRTCRAMFQHERWNCSFEEAFLDTGYPQAGFVWAVAAAKAVEELALACRRGEPGLSCPCRFGNSRRVLVSAPSGPGTPTGRPPRTERSADVGGQQQLRALTPESISRKYGYMSLPSCDDNLRLASRRVRQFFADTRANLRAVEGPLPLTLLANWHNRRAGQITARHSQVKICHCMGVSGSCTKQVCIKGMRRLSGKLEANLRQLLLDSKPVQVVTSKQRRKKERPGQRRSNRWSSPSKLVLVDGVAAIRKRTRAAKKDLVHWRPQPDYCLGSRQDGYYGVQDRACNATTAAVGLASSCARLCCGRYNYALHYVTQREWCQCQMKSNPIRVDCQLCENRVLTHRCRLYRREL